MLKTFCVRERGSWRGCRSFDWVRFGGTAGEFGARRFVCGTWRNTGVCGIYGFR